MHEQPQVNWNDDDDGDDNDRKLSFHAEHSEPDVSWRFHAAVSNIGGQRGNAGCRAVGEDVTLARGESRSSDVARSTSVSVCGWTDDAVKLVNEMNGCQDDDDSDNTLSTDPVSSTHNHHHHVILSTRAAADRWTSSYGDDVTSAKLAGAPSPRLIVPRLTICICAKTYNFTATYKEHS